MNYWRLTPLVDRRLEKPSFAVHRIGDLVDKVQYGCSALAKSEAIGVPMLRMSNLQNDGWDLGELKYIELTDSEISNYKLAPGDILFNRTNSKELVGKCEVFRESGDWVFASYLIRVRTDTSLLLPQFASDFLSTEIGRLQIDRFSRQIIGMTNINAEEICELRIPLPPVSEQRSLIAAMDSARAERRANLAEADALLAGIDDYLLTTLGLTPPPKDERKVFAVRGRGVPARFDPHFHLPAFAQILRMLTDTMSEQLANISTFSNEIWTSKKHDGPTFRYIEISSVDRDTGEAYAVETKVADAPSRARMAVRTGDIIISLTRPHHGSIAQIAPELAVSSQPDFLLFEAWMKRW